MLKFFSELSISNHKDFRLHFGLLIYITGYTRIIEVRIELKR